MWVYRFRSHGARGIAHQLRYRDKTRKIKNTKESHGLFNNTASIHNRSISVENLSRLGHWKRLGRLAYHLQLC